MRVKPKLSYVFCIIANICCLKANSLGKKSLIPLAGVLDSIQGFLLYVIK